jgi:plasmid segregation protein ParM
VVHEGNWIDKNSGSCSGGHVLVDQVVARVREERGYDLSLIQATKAVCDGWFKECGLRIAVEPYIASSASILIDEVMDTASHLLDQDARTLDGIMVAGGAAPLLFPVIRAKYPHAIMAEYSRMTLAEGFCRFGCALRNDQKVQRDRAAQAAAVTA